jgi:hypothetical protein
MDSNFQFLSRGDQFAPRFVRCCFTQLPSVSESATILTRVPFGNKGMRSALTVSFSNGRSEMADRELIAAILTAGMLPTLEIPPSRSQTRSGRVTRAEGGHTKRR